MSAARRHKKHHHEEHENHERWLVSGYDMMTLLFAVFVVLFAISSTNISKVKIAAAVAAGGLLRAGPHRRPCDDGDRRPVRRRAARRPTPPLPSLTPAQALEERMSGDDGSKSDAEAAEAAAKEEQDFQTLKRRIDKLAQEAGPDRQGLDDRVAARPQGPPDDRQACCSTPAARCINPGALPRCSTRSAHSSRPRPSTPSSSKVTPTTARSRLRSTRPTGSCPAHAPRRSSSASCPTACRPKRTSLLGYASQHPVARTPPRRTGENRRVEIILTRCMEQPSRKEATETP